MKKTHIFASAVSGLLLAACGTEIGLEDEAATEQPVKCAGINTCAGTSECAGGPGDSSCQGMNTCAGEGWITSDSEEKCEEDGGESLGPV